MAPPKIIHYIVVVHGMGVARQNETILSVASRFAEARNKSKPWDPPPIVVPLGSATGQTGIDKYDGTSTGGLPWVEFAHLPANPVPPVEVPFFAQPDTSGNNLRFVNIHWNDLLDKDWDTVGQPPNLWVDGLLGRLIRKDRFGKPPVPRWIIETLRTLGESISLVRKYTAFRAKDFDDLAFNKYLGDVQLYGEYAYTRGQAVRRFHNRMADVAAKHEALHESDPDPQKHIKAQYTIIAHSLGTIMAADALLLARADLRKFMPATPSNNPQLDAVISGYFSGDEISDPDKEEGRPATHVDLCNRQRLWINNVTSFVTLGSPIDKFLIIWWLNYEYWLHTHWLSPGPVIDHYNYCEEQDPVGHHLDVAHTAPAFNAVFREMEDRVYTRFAIPGLAHIQYFNDLDLFTWILGNTVDKSYPSAPPPKEPVWFIPGIYWWVVGITYIIVPLAIATVQTIAMNWAWNADGFSPMILGAGLFVASWLMGRYILDLMIWWRQVLKAKSKIAEGEPANSAPPPPFGGPPGAPPDGPSSPKGPPPSSPPNAQAAGLSDPAALPSKAKSSTEAEGVKRSAKSNPLMDVGTMIAGIPMLLKWALHLNHPAAPQNPPKIAPSVIQNNVLKARQRARWDAEYKVRAKVESRFRGALLILHWSALLLLGITVANYCWSLPLGSIPWEDISRLAILGALAALMVVVWIIAAHGDVAAWQKGPRQPGFRTLSAPRLQSILRRDAAGRPGDTGVGDRSADTPANLSPRPPQPNLGLKIEGFFDSDKPGIMFMLFFGIAGICAGLLLREQKIPFPCPWLQDHPAAAMAILWSTFAFSGVMGYTRTRLKKVKELLAADDDQIKFEFPAYFASSPRSADSPKTPL